MSDTVTLANPFVQTHRKATLLVKLGSRLEGELKLGIQEWIWKSPFCRLHINIMKISLRVLTVRNTDWK